MSRYSKATPHRHAKRRDKVEAPILRGLRRAFPKISIWELDRVDVAVGWQGRTLFIEFKSTKTFPLSKQRQVDQLRDLIHFQGELYCVNNLEDAIDAVNGQLDIPDPAYNLGEWYTDEGGSPFHQVTGAKFLLGDWWYEVDGVDLLPEGKMSIK